MQQENTSTEEDFNRSILTDTEIFDSGINKRMKAIFISMGLSFNEKEMEYYALVIPLFIKEM